MMKSLRIALCVALAFAGLAYAQPIKPPFRPGFRSGIVLPASNILPETAAWAAACSTPPTAPRLALVNTYISSLIADGVWAKLDTLYILASETSQCATINVRNPGTNTISLVNSPTFTVDRGFAGNGSSSYLDTNWTASTQGVQYTLSASHIMSWSRTVYSGSGAFADLGAQEGSASNPIAAIAGDSTGVSGYLNTPIAAPAVTNASTVVGMRILTGTASAQTLYLNGSSVASGTTSAVAIPTVSMLICALKFAGGAAGFYSTRQFAFISTGGFLTSTQASAFYTDTQTLATAIGV